VVERKNRDQSAYSLSATDPLSDKRPRRNQRARGALPYVSQSVRVGNFQRPQKDSRFLEGCLCVVSQIQGDGDKDQKQRPTVCPTPNTQSPLQHSMLEWQKASDG
jgi:hypothetical protein